MLKKDLEFALASARVRYRIEKKENSRISHLALVEFAETHDAEEVLHQIRKVLVELPESREKELVREWALIRRVKSPEELKGYDGRS